jgi:hypothetical protein
MALPKELTMIPIRSSTRLKEKWRLSTSKTMTLGKILVMAQETMK